MNNKEKCKHENLIDARTLDNRETFICKDCGRTIMKYFIKINTNTIKENPAFFKGKEYIGGKYSIFFEGKGIIPNFINNSDKFFITDESLITTDEHFGLEFKGIVTRELSENELKLCEFNDIELIFSRETIETTTPPREKYLYNYKNKEIQCKECGSKFDHSYLKTELETDDFVSYNVLCTVCPICGEWNCCNIEYESIDDALKRKNL